MSHLGYNVFPDLKIHKHELIHVVQDKKMLVAKCNESNHYRIGIHWIET